MKLDFISLFSNYVRLINSAFGVLIKNHWARNADQTRCHIGGIFYHYPLTWLFPYIGIWLSLFTKATIRLLMLYIQKIQIRTMSYFMKTDGQTDRQWDITCSFQSQPQIPWRCLSAEEINFSNFLIPGLLTRCTYLVWILVHNMITPDTRK